MRWYDYLWLLIPFVGLPAFVAAVTERCRRERRRGR